MGIIKILKRKLYRAMRAQEEAERLLEQKSRELYELNYNLEKQIELRTQELKSVTEEAINANKAKSQFLANMSHEIRTPLNGMLGFIGLLEKSELQSSQREQLRVVAKSGRLLLSIINDVLEFSKIEAGKLDLEKTPFHLKRCVEDIVDVMAHQVFEKGLEFPVYLDENIPKNLIGDEARLRQVMLNLIGNAIKFTPTGEIAVTIRSLGLNKTGDCDVYFEVRDTGVGISSDKIKTIFIAFEQADISDTRRYGGTGLGLTISKQIVEAMGGALNVDSQEGVGTVFFFTLPIGVASHEPLEFTTRNFNSRESAAVIVNNITVRNNLINRLSSWNVTTEVFHALNEIDWSFAGETNKNLLVDYFFLSSPDTRTKIQSLIENGVHVMIIGHPELKAALSEEFAGLKVDILNKPVKREELFKSIQEKRDILNIPSEPSKSSVPLLDAALVSSNPSNFVGAARILLVEDNLVNQQVAMAILELYGHQADLANHGKEAVALVQQNKYDLVLMDCQMPIMDGFEATKTIRKFDQHLCIIAMTANAFKQTKEKCFEVGMNDFVTKPVSDEQLAEVINRNLLKVKVVQAS